MRRSTKTRSLAAISPASPGISAIQMGTDAQLEMWYGDQIRAGEITREEAQKRMRWVTVGLLGWSALWVGVAGYHGYKRGGNDWGSAAGWGFFGLLGGPLTGAVALAQGYGKRK